MGRVNVSRNLARAYHPIMHIKGEKLWANHKPHEKPIFCKPYGCDQTKSDVNLNYLM
jgi:hypothetical protein